jgi:MFS family permease
MSIAALIVTTALGVYDFVIPYFTEEFAASYTIIGFTIALAFIGSFIADIPLGVIADKIGRKKMLLVSTILFAILGVFFYFSHNIFLIMALCFTFGIANVAFWVPSTVLIREETPKGMASQSQSLYLLLSDFGWIVGPMIGGFVLTLISTEFNFLIFSALAVIGLIASFFMIKQKKKIKKEKKNKTDVKKLFSEFKTTFKEYPKVHKFAVTAYFLSLAVFIWIGTKWTFVVLAGKNIFGLSGVILGIVMGLMMVVQGFLYYSSGYLMDKVGVRYVLLAGFLFLFTCAYFIFLSNSALMYILFLLLAGGAVAWILPGTESLATSVIPANKREKMTGVFNSSRDLGLVVGPIVGGIIADLSGDPLLPFLFVTIICGIAAIMTLRLWGKHALKLK